MKRKHLEMYMRIAEAVALTSSARRLQVGAVAVKNNMVIGTGYNALPSGIDGDCETKLFAKTEFWWLFDGSQSVKDVDLEKFCATHFPYKEDNGDYYQLITKSEVHHAELNLIINLAKSTESSKDCTIFCTHACCKQCSQLIVDSGCKKFYYRNLYRDSSGLDYLVANNVEVEQI